MSLDVISEILRTLEVAWTRSTMGTSWGAHGYFTIFSTPASSTLLTSGTTPVAVTSANIRGSTCAIHATLKIGSGVSVVSSKVGDNHKVENEQGIPENKQA